MCKFIRLVIDIINRATEILTRKKIEMSFKLQIIKVIKVIEKNDFCSFAEFDGKLDSDYGKPKSPLPTRPERSRFDEKMASIRASRFDIIFSMACFIIFSKKTITNINLFMISRSSR